MKIAVKFLIALGLSLLLVWAVRTYAFTVFTVPAGGLPPHLEEGNRLIVNRIDCDFFQSWRDSGLCRFRGPSAPQPGLQPEQQPGFQPSPQASNRRIFHRANREASWRYPPHRQGELRHPHGVLQALRLQGLPLLSPKDACR